MSGDDVQRMAIGAWHRELGGTGEDAGIRIFEFADERAPALVRHLVPDCAVGSIVWSASGILALDERKGGADGAIGGRLLALDPTVANDADAVSSEISTQGPFPCSLARDPDGRLVAVANYGSEDFVTRSDRDAGGAIVVRREYDHGSIVLVELDGAGRPQPVRRQCHQPRLCRCGDATLAAKQRHSPPSARYGSARPNRAPPAPAARWHGLHLAIAKPRFAGRTHRHCRSCRIAQP